MATFPDDAILVVLDVTPAGSLASSSAALIGAAGLVGTPVALIVGGDPAAAAPLGAAVVLHADPAATPTASLVDAVSAAIDLVQPDAILLSHSVDGRDVAGRLAARRGLAVSVDAVSASRDDEGVVAHHSVYGGAYTSTSAPTFGPLLATIRQGAVDARQSASEPEIHELAVIPSGHRVATIGTLTPSEEESGRPDLRSAARVVAGGLGLRSAEDFSLVESLADTIGAAVAASRAIVDAGYVPHAYQVGQTGVSVSPQLYIALGVSGAVQHRVGMQTAKTIIAVNSDPEAPIFDIADFGVVGDLYQIVPQLIDALAAAKE